MPQIPIQTLSLFPKLDQLLLELLHSLYPEDWEKPTIAPLWNVKDIATHLLDGNLRTLSMLRDGYFGESPGDINGYQDLVKYLNRLNSDWVNVMKRLSPNVLVQLLESSGKEYIGFLNTLDPFEKAAFSVAWAGETESQNWFHIAREYTEKWHHQQQIRLAVGKEEILYNKEFYDAFLQTSLRALPYHYRDLTGKEGEVIRVTVEGESNWNWWIIFNSNSWKRIENPTTNPVSQVIIPAQIAWRIFTKGISKVEAKSQISISGKQEYGEKILGMLTVMA
ncbi:MAG: maleylpyruvate isomerase N-terminal domain-containing protein [Algoriphagus sp.]|nr:maleylpyruvate isomerase N-terminal domain-containing protein [Algoriphagus sp.]